MITDCKVSANFGENQGLNDPPINSFFRNNKIYNSNGRTLFEIDGDASFTEASGNEVYMSGSELGGTVKLSSGYTVNQSLDQAVPFTPVINPATAAAQTGHDYSQIFIEGPNIPEVPTVSADLTLPIEMNHDGNNSILLVEYDFDQYMNIYISSDLAVRALYSPVTQATTSGIHSISIADGEVLNQGLTPDLTKVFFRADVDSSAHGEVTIPEDGVFTENGGLVVIEAESFTSRSEGSDS